MALVDSVGLGTATYVAFVLPATFVADILLASALSARVSLHTWMMVKSCRKSLGRQQW